MHWGGEKSLTAGFEPAIPGGLVFKTSALPGYATSASQCRLLYGRFFDLRRLDEVFPEFLCQRELRCPSGLGGFHELRFHELPDILVHLRADLPHQLGFQDAVVLRYERQGAERTL